MVGGLAAPGEKKRLRGRAQGTGKALRPLVAYSSAPLACSLLVAAGGYELVAVGLQQPLPLIPLSSPRSHAEPRA